MEKIIKIQFYVLFAGTVFAWGNFSYELYSWLNQKNCELGCQAFGPNPNPFLTPCFFGALFFLTALILNILILKSLKSRN